MTTAQLTTNIHVFDDLKAEVVEFYWEPSEIEGIETDVRGDECTYDKNNQSHTDAIDKLVYSVLDHPRLHEDKTVTAASGTLFLEEGVIRFSGNAVIDGKNMSHFTLHDTYQA